MSLSRRDVLVNGEDIKHNAFWCMRIVQGVSNLSEEFVGEFLLNAISVYGSVVRIQMLETISTSMLAGNLTQEALGESMDRLCVLLDKDSLALAKKALLVQEVLDAPKQKH